MPKKETVLHEILAVENGLGETSNRILKDTAKKLGTKQSLFAGQVKSHEIFDEDNQNMLQVTEHKEVESTVAEQLQFAGTEIARYWDASLQKESANQNANADIIIDGQVIASNIPSIVLLSMEKKLTALLDVYNAIPTLDAAKAWTKDEGYAKEGVFRTTHPAERQHSVTSKEFKEISPATKEHKAQIAQVETIEVIGKYTIHDFSGAITSHNKANKLQRLTALIRAVKTARQRANNTVVNTERKFGADLFDYING